MVEENKSIVVVLFLFMTSQIQSKALDPANEINLRQEQAITTPCPEELLLQNQINKTIIEEKFETNTNQYQKDESSLSKLKLSLLKETANDNSSLSSSEEDSGEKSSESTTLCPEDLKKELQDPNKQTLQESENTQSTEDKESGRKDEMETTTICPEEAKKLLEESENVSTEKILNKSDSLTSLDITTTECPNKVLNLQAEPEELAKKVVQPQKEIKQENITTYTGDLPNTQKRHQFQDNSSVLITTTPCPDEVANKVSEEISVKTLLDVQKDSVLLKLVSGKPSVYQQHQERQKRQSSSFDYSSYYPTQSGYSSDSLASSSDNKQTSDNYQITQQQTYQYQPLKYNSRTSVSHVKKNTAAHNANNKKIQTYQQLQRQPQNVYSKHQGYQQTYHIKQPVKGYRNPSLYMRYPTKNSYYKVKNGSNRRQFQGRYSSTTVRSTRATIKKKFRPSPVFA